MHKPLIVVVLLSVLVGLVVLPALAQAPVPLGGASSTDVGAGTTTDTAPVDRTTNNIVIAAVVLAVIAIIAALAMRRKTLPPPAA